MNPPPRQTFSTLMLTSPGSSGSSPPTQVFVMVKPFSASPLTADS